METRYQISNDLMNPNQINVFDSKTDYKIGCVIKEGDHRWTAYPTGHPDATFTMQSIALGYIASKFYYPKTRQKKNEIGQTKLF
jgi:hypothetical protein